MAFEKVLTGRSSNYQDKRWYSAREKTKSLEQKIEEQEQNNSLVDDYSLLKALTNSNDKILKQINEIKQAKKFYQIAPIEKNQEQDIRCYKHNSFIILFCEKEKELLCSNCVYSSAYHKNHKISQAKNAKKIIQFQVKIKNRTLKDYQHRLIQQQMNTNKQSTSLQYLYNEYLQKLIEIHKEKVVKLSNEFLQMKDRLNKEYKKFKQFFEQKELRMSELIRQCTYAHVSEQVSYIVYNAIEQRLNECFKIFLKKQQTVRLLKMFKRNAKTIQKLFIKI